MQRNAARSPTIAHVRLLIALLLCGWFALSGYAGARGPEDGPEGSAVTGVVFHDRDGDGVQDRFELGISGVAVSNGRDVARTDWRGRYRLPVSDDTIVFVVKPGGFAMPLDENHLPRFYYVHKPDGSPPGLRFPGVAPTGPLPASVDFPLTRQHEPNTFDVLLFGDTQPYTAAEIDTLAHDIIEEVIGSEAAFGITLGDLVGDDLSLFDPLNRAVGRVGIPWHNLPGNHDMNYRAQSDVHADETFERVYGPGTYAFEYASVHFVLFDDVVYLGALAEGDSTQNYIGGLSADQLTFLRGYLEGVPRDHLIVVAMHIPLEGPAPNFDVPERRELFDALASHPYNLSISAHMHMQYHAFFGPEDGYRGPEPHHHLVQGTTSGSWWLGTRDEMGIPHAMMRDGTPNGYSILHCDGNTYSIRYKVARRPADHQMNVFAPDAVSASDAGDTEVLVNVFAGSERSTVEMRLGRGGEWIPLARVERPDPYFLEHKRRELEHQPPPERPLPPAEPSLHLWAGTLPADPPSGTFALEVRAIDMFGKIFTAHRIIRVD
jgi:hypothetical protein